MTRRSKTPLLLMEAVIMLLVFAVSASVCIQVFVGARAIAEESYILDRAGIEVQRAAELWQSTKGNLQETADLLQAKVVDNGLEANYNEDWILVEAPSEFLLTVKTQEAKAQITLYQKETSIFSIQTEAVMFGE